MGGNPTASHPAEMAVPGAVFPGLRTGCGPRDLAVTLHDLDKSDGVSGGAAADPRHGGADSPWKEYAGRRPEGTHRLCDFLSGFMNLLPRDGKRQRGLWRMRLELGPETERAHWLVNLPCQDRAQQKLAQMSQTGKPAARWGHYS